MVTGRCHPGRCHLRHRWSFSETDAQYVHANPNRKRRGAAELSPADADQDTDQGGRSTARVRRRCKRGRSKRRRHGRRSHRLRDGTSRALGTH